MKIAKQKLEGLRGKNRRLVWCDHLTSVGFLPSDLAQAAAVLGLTQILADVFTPVVRSAMAGKEVIDSDMYFLWRVREEQERNIR